MRKPIIYKKETLKVWESYMEKLFKEDGSKVQNSISSDKSPVILKSEVLHAIKTARNK